MKFIKECMIKVLNRLGIEIHRILPTDWSNNKDFKRLFEKAREHTVIDPQRCFMLWQLAGYAASKGGDVAEVGVYKGGSAMIIAKACPDKKVHLFDTFSGMPKVETGIDGHKEMDFSNTSLGLVRDFLADCSNVVFHPGFFPDTASIIKDRKFCFVHVDADIYTSVRDCLKFFYDKMSTGGIIVFDDYMWKACHGVEKALNEFFMDKAEKPIVTTRSQCAIIKV